MNPPITSTTLLVIAVAALLPYSAILTCVVAWLCGERVSLERERKRLQDRALWHNGLSPVSWSAPEDMFAGEANAPAAARRDSRPAPYDRTKPLSVRKRWADHDEAKRADKLRQQAMVKDDLNGNGHVTTDDMADLALRMKGATE